MLSRRRISRLGYRPDLPDIRDHHYAPALAVLHSLPPAMELAVDFSAYNQGELGSCTANALAATKPPANCHKEARQYVNTTITAVQPGMPRRTMQVT
ncbi:hypothetical protein PCO85_13640 [Prodigiosinella aquatilis]|nr:hypothetical protein [Prodigiosinella sp. LS101]WJV52287.1 hypothetical protein PCO85_13640 [Prodigiosinella sp. LS101]WJV56641.1 hypothetical protein PCO84_13630 [Pectobacteriaceae bacterium C111]